MSTEGNINAKKKLNKRQRNLRQKKKLLLQQNKHKPNQTKLNLTIKRIQKKEKTSGKNKKNIASQKPKKSSSGEEFEKYLNLLNLQDGSENHINNPVENLLKQKLARQEVASKISCNWKKLKNELDESMKEPPNKRRNVRSISVSVSSDILEKKNAWFDDGEPLNIISQKDGVTQHRRPHLLVKENAFKGPTREIAIDCEMVGVGMRGSEDMLARVSVVNNYGHVLYDEHVKPMEAVVDFRTEVSGIRPENLKNAQKTFQEVQKDVAQLLDGKILVGHSVKHDLHCLLLKHPRKKIRDTSKYRPFKKLFSQRTPSLKGLSNKVLGVSIQRGEHNSVEDARATMRLYTLYRKEWEEPYNMNYKRRVQLAEEVAKQIEGS